ncbi:acyl-[acyl-carrier-protein] thioesterase [Nitratidesulfovibrio liaohensis]|uniref:acyl-[acyl-carrier-protein] thioesterase n=1 Tax=Nitratidesulfovibrio liaohensis TaxID=2604158 RepID=UPI00141ED0F4|nr:acyl-ACP thioesterase domain-containing protein [Nitratidesulfovibrio liaohensis]NHZ48739.1 acyl-ACP thioesterase [Nitratidesulfovibrio liaohensis]
MTARHDFSADLASNASAVPAAAPGTHGVAPGFGSSDVPADLRVHHEIFRVRGYEVGPDGTVSAQIICDYLQEAAGAHADRLGLSLAALHEQGQAWVLARLAVQVERAPAEGETVTVRTWPCGVERLQFRRDYLMLGQDGAVVARGASFWVVINLATRRPERIPPTVAALLPENPPLALDGSLLGDRRPPAPAEDAVTLSSRSFAVRRADMDRNRHVNNVRYLDWALEGVPAEVQETSRPVWLDMHFRAETVYGDTVEAHCLPAPADTTAPGAARFVHVLTRRSDGREVARALTGWRQGICFCSEVAGTDED